MKLNCNLFLTSSLFLLAPLVSTSFADNNCPQVTAKQECLKNAADMALKVCGEVQTSGASQTSQKQIEANYSNKFLKFMAALNASAKAEKMSTEYKNALQEEIPEIIRDNAACRTAIYTHTALNFCNNEKDNHECPASNYFQGTWMINHDKANHKTLLRDATVFDQKGVKRGKWECTAVQVTYDNGFVDRLSTSNMIGKIQLQGTNNRRDNIIYDNRRVK